jgi:phage recombination protein Bet
MPAKEQNGAVAVVEKPTTPEAITKRGISEAQWKTLTNSLYPGANPNSVLMVWDYCKARQLDPLKKPCHIVPMRVKNSRTNDYEWRDVVMPGIYEYRTTAQRTGEYLGHSKPEYGEPVTIGGLEVPEWCEMTMYRWNKVAGQKVEFPVRVYFEEVVATNREGKPNDRWSKAPIQMMTKCTEAAGLREAFPDEFGGEPTAEEMDGQRGTIEVESTRPLPPKPEQYDEWLAEITAKSEKGIAVFSEAWRTADQAMRVYLAATDPERQEALQERAMQVDEP